MLQKLSLAYCPKVTNLTLEVIRSKVNKLQSIELNGCNITDEGVRYIMSGCRQLSHLSLANIRKLTDKGLQGISKYMKLYRNLRYVYPLLESFFDNLGEITCLIAFFQFPRGLILNRCKYFSNEGLLLLMQDGGGILTQLHLLGCTQVNELGLMGFRRTIKSYVSMLDLDLRYVVEGCGVNFSFISSYKKIYICSLLCLFNNKSSLFPSLLISFTSINDPALCWISEGCKKLENLKLNGCGALTDSGMHYLAQGSNRFRSLSLKGCTKLTDYAMGALIESPVFEIIQALDLSGCLFLEDPTISALGEYCHLLRDLNLMGLSRCTDVGFKSLGEGCPNLQSLDLSIDLSFLDTTHRSRIPR